MLSIVEKRRHQKLKQMFEHRNTRLEEFGRRYPHIFSIVHHDTLTSAVGDWCRNTLSKVLDEETIYEQIREWAAEHLTDFEIFGTLIGIKDENEAFHFKLCWQ